MSIVAMVTSIIIHCTLIFIAVSVVSYFFVFHVCFFKSKPPNNKKKNTYSLNNINKYTPQESTFQYTLKMFIHYILFIYIINVYRNVIINVSYRSLVINSVKSFRSGVPYVPSHSNHRKWDNQWINRSLNLGVGCLILTQDEWQTNAIKLLSVTSWVGSTKLMYNILSPLV